MTGSSLSAASSGFQGNLDPSTQTSELTALQFLIGQALAAISTATLARVEAVDGDAKTVDVLPLVNQVDGNGANATPHGTVFGLPFVRIQGGDGAFIADPQVGDIGLVVACDRSISAVKKAKGPANPGTFRKFSLADGIFIGGVLNADATQYVKLTAGGIQIVAVGDLTASASGNVSASATGKMVLSATSTAQLTGELVQLGPGGGDIATAPAPAKTLLTNYAASGAAAVVTNPTGSAASTLDGNLVLGGSIDVGLQNLVTMGTITGADLTAIETALGIVGSGGLKASNTALLAHTNRLSGLTAPTVSSQPFLDGVVGLGAGLDFLAGGFFGPSSTAIPASSTGLGATATIAAADTYALSIPAIIAGGTTVAAVIAQVGTYTTSFNAYPTADTAAYAAAHASVTAASGFLGFVGYAKTTIPSVETFFGQLASPSTIATLQSV